MEYGLYTGILVIFGILFLLSRGGFRSAAVYIRKRSRVLETTLSVSTLTRILVILFAADLLAIAVTKQEGSKAAAEDGYLYRAEYGGTASEQVVSLKKNGQKEQVRIDVEPRKLTQEEIGQSLKEAARLLPKTVLGNQSADHVTQDVTLPDSVGTPSVSCEWITDHPEWIGWDGTIGEDIPEEGVDVTLTCELTLEDQSKETSLTLRVFPKALTKQKKLEKEVEEAIREENSATVRKVRLPSEIDGESVEWLPEESRDGAKILAVGVLLAAMMALSRRKEEEKRKENREKGLQADYPNIIERFVLFMNAGLSVRVSLQKMADLYRERAAKEGQNGRGRQLRFRRSRAEHPGLTEICHVMDDMHKGMTELEAYERLGQRCGTPEYRTFSDLLIRCSAKGGRDVLILMQKEAEEAREMRRRRARIQGGEAGTKILVPMILMLVIVMAILMVPAMLNL